MLACMHMFVWMDMIRKFASTSRILQQLYRFGYQNRIHFLVPCFGSLFWFPFWFPFLVPLFGSLFWFPSARQPNKKSSACWRAMLPCDINVMYITISIVVFISHGSSARQHADDICVGWRATMPAHLSSAWPAIVPIKIVFCMLFISSPLLDVKTSRALRVLRVLWMQRCQGHSIIEALRVLTMAGCICFNHNQARRVSDSQVWGPRGRVEP